MKKVACKASLHCVARVISALLAGFGAVPHPSVTTVPEPILVYVAGVLVKDIVDLVIGEVDADINDELLHVVYIVISLKS